MNKVLNNLFACYAPKSRTYSTTMNLTNHILLTVYFHSCSYECVFTKMYISLDMNISELLFLQIKIMDTGRECGRIYKKNTHIKILRDQMIQHRVRYKNLKQAKDET